MIVGMPVAIATSVAIWVAVYSLTPPIAGMTLLTSRFVYAINWVCVAVLLCFLTGIEAVSHERLPSEAFDPLAGKESARLRINLRYLQNTLEQFLLFVPGLIALAACCSDARYCAL